MKLKSRKHSIDSLFTLLLLLVFALFTLMLSAMGSAIYQNGISHLNENYTSRTAIAYLAEKVRQHDAAGDIFLTEVEEIPAVGFRDTIDESPFITYVYYYDGALRELFVHADNTPLADMGSRIVELESFEIRTPDDTASESETGQAAGEGNPRLLYATAADREGRQLSILIHSVCS